MLPAIWIAQREYGGCLTHEALEEVARLLGRPAVEVEGVATFYSMYNVGTRGRRHIEVCTCLTCSVLGAGDVVRTFEQRLGIRAGETTDDGEFSLSKAECLNWCEAGPVVQVGDRYYGNVTPDKVDDLLEQISATEDSTVAAQAAAVVRAHLRGRGTTKDMAADG
jgi:NADH-quinone oxidoreductase subunit E